LNAYKAAWVRLHGSFTGVPNVQFAFDVNNDSVPATAGNGLLSYSPGGNFVDLVGVDGFDFGGQTWALVFGPALQTLKAAYPKPLWILSTGSVDNQPKFISDMVAGVKQFGIQGGIYFDYQQFTAPASTLQGL
jgi:beta-mannanase